MKPPVPIVASLLTLLTVLFFGLNPKGYDFSNHVAWIDDGPGVRFDKYGIAFTRLDRKLLERFGGRDGFSVLMVLQAGRNDKTGSGHIFTMDSGYERNQLVIWQWSSYIIAMNDNDYTHRRNVGRVSAELPSQSAQEIYLSLTTGRNGTILYFDGQIVSSNDSLLLEFPISDQTKLVLGNSVYGSNPWQGKISGLALFDRKLEPETVKSLYNSWVMKRSFADAEVENPFILYLFNEKSGTSIINQAGAAAPLRIPSRATPLRKKFLTGFWNDSEIKGNLARDALINLVGFIPVGFFIAGALIKLGGKLGKRPLVYAVILCFAVSLTIEIIQTWIPGRSSQSLDLLLNTLGAFLGAFVSKRS